MNTSSKYLIIGGGIAAHAACMAIRERDPNGVITLLNAEKHAPYDRPPLSKKLWKGQSVDSIQRDTGKLDINLQLDVVAIGGNPYARQVHDDRGNTHSYQKLLLATGSQPRRFPFADPDVTYFRTLDDYRRVREVAERSGRFTVVGGGFIGSEMAAALCDFGCKVTLLFPEHGIGAGIFPSALSQFLNDYYWQRGVTVMPNETVKHISTDNGKASLTTSGGLTIHSDAIIAGLGVEPEVWIAQAMGLQTGNGVHVDRQLRTSSPNVFAAGDVANFYNPYLGKRQRVEHEDNALAMGRIAGLNMVECTESYDHIPFFYSDLFDLGYEAVGNLSSSLVTIQEWDDPFRKGTVYYTREGLVQGVLLWNIWDRLEQARDLIGSRLQPQVSAA